MLFHTIEEKRYILDPYVLFKTFKTTYRYRVDQGNPETHGVISEFDEKTGKVKIELFSDNTDYKHVECSRQEIPEILQYDKNEMSIKPKIINI